SRAARLHRRPLRALRRRGPAGLRRRPGAGPRPAGALGARLRVRAGPDRDRLGVRSLSPPRRRLDPGAPDGTGRAVPAGVRPVSDREEPPLGQSTDGPDRWGRRLDSPWTWLAGITLLTAACTQGLLRFAPWEKVVPDFICYWAAGKLVAAGQSPYDEARQTRLQHERGWDRATDGLGAYDFLPYDYPPWFAAGCALPVPLGYEGSKAAWFALNLELLLLAGYLLRDAVPGLPRSVPPVAVPIFGLSVVALFVGQTSLAVLFLVALAWRLL